MNRLLIPIVAIAACTAAPGAAKSVKVGGATYYLHTNSDGGRCRTRDLRDGVTEIVCREGPNMAALNTELGCLDSEGAGYCGKGVPHRAALSGSQLNCPGGRSFFLFSGVASDNNCRSVGGEKSCQTSDGKGYARANCAGGCLETAAGGGCCSVGQGCPPGESAGETQQ